MTLIIVTLIQILLVALLFGCTGKKKKQPTKPSPNIAVAASNRSKMSGADSKKEPCVPKTADKPAEENEKNDEKAKENEKTKSEEKKEKPKVEDPADEKKKTEDTGDKKEAKKEEKKEKEKEEKKKKEDPPPPPPAPRNPDEKAEITNPIVTPETDEFPTLEDEKTERKTELKTEKQQSEKKDDKKEKVDDKKKSKTNLAK